MTEFEFTLKFRLPDSGADPSDYVEELGEQGCNDALIGIGQEGRTALNFCRAANSAFEAISSAIADVKAVIPGAQIIEAAPDFVGSTDIAELLRCSRQYMRKLMINNGAGFPAPVHAGKTALWRLSEILIWLNNSKSYQLAESLMDVAKVARQVNIAKEALGSDPALQKSILRLVS